MMIDKWEIRTLRKLIHFRWNVLFLSYLFIAISLNSFGKEDKSTGVHLHYSNYSSTNLVDKIHFGSSSDPLNGLTVTWGSLGTNDSIKWGYTNQYEFGNFPGTRRDNYAGYFYDYSFPSLSADSTIYYKIYDSLMQGWTEEKSYLCSSDSATSQFSFLVMGDSQSHFNEWHSVSNAANKNNTDFTLFTGDIVENGNINADWNGWFKYGASFLEKNLVYHTIGNHDCTGGGNNTYMDIFTLPKNPSNNEYYYSFSYGNAIFICLNSEEGSTGTNSDTQYNWLLDVLQKNQHKTWKFIWYHRPFCSAGPHSGEMYYKMDTWFQAFDDYGVDMMFSGHEHMYEKSKPVQKNRTVVDQYGSNYDQGRCQIVTGGAGASLHTCSILPWIETAASKLNYCKIEINENSLRLAAYDLHNIQFDSLTIHKNNAVSGEELESNKVATVYPNPVTQVLKLKNIPNHSTISIFNIYGIKIKELKNEFKRQIKINMNGHEQGIYLVRIMNTNVPEQTLKVIKK